jgi:hypothetical protein
VRDYTTLNRCCQDASASKIGQSEEILGDNWPASAPQQSGVEKRDARRKSGEE